MGQAEFNKTPTIACPRCGYDQRGVVAAWEDSCPLSGLCVECGLTFSWPEVIHPEKFQPQWCIEFIESRRVVRGCRLTLLYSLLPWRLWSRLHMSYEVRGRRLLLYCCFLLTLLVLCYAALQTLVATRVRVAIERNPRITSVAMPYATAMTEAMLQPLRRNSAGSVLVVGGKFQYPSPRGLYESLDGRRKGFRTLDFTMNGMLPSIVFAWVFGSIAFLLVPVEMVLLPVSRRRAKVRWRHIWRIWAYGLVGPTLLGVAFFVCALIRYAIDDGTQKALAIAFWLNSWLLLPLLALWWALAIRNYLRMPHGLVTALLLVNVAALIETAALWFIEPSQADKLLRYVFYELGI